MKDASLKATGILSPNYSMWKEAELSISLTPSTYCPVWWSVLSTLLKSPHRHSELSDETHTV